MHQKYIYKKIEPYETGYLKVSNLHTIYYEISGNPDGIPIFHIHGGPGGGSGPDNRRMFNPQKFKIIVYDQRGCGMSTPFAEIKENTTHDLIRDIEKLRIHLKLDKISLFGGSWGTTLSLLYAIHYPQNVHKIILRGVYLGRQEDTHWLSQEGASKFYPIDFEKYISIINPSERNDLVTAYNKLLNHEDEAIALKAAQHWAQWEMALISVKRIKAKKDVDPKELLPIARIENHYFINKLFLNDDNFILNNIDKISHIPVDIVHGQLDMDCLPIQAYLLHKKLPNSRLFIIDGAGHTWREKGIAKKLVELTDEL
ncbi:prolyl aminopeptidase [Mycoplasmopsis equigenitalium]|uniref:Proline iminopeptidase n=1 Tax=Mycoplasmopsis equigenitalium TaxID=114883 RepID=A0ABY5J2J5_9BACT|nr:prolyl aminopeptidase [Mycoplasmopsis equigenitalium]UUD36993.1 prolyl aminopeptidase [Mycoplasmopsis equigenitalium]